jgi:hypothetical protein
LGLANTPVTAVTTKRRQLAQVKPSRWGLGEGSPIKPGSAGVGGVEASRMGRGAPPGLGLPHTERFAFGDHHDAVVEEPVEQADRGGVLGQEPALLVKRPVRADAQGAAFVGGGDEAE